MPSQVKSGVENIVPETQDSMTNDREFLDKLGTEQFNKFIGNSTNREQKYLVRYQNLVFDAVAFETQVKCRQLIIHLKIIWQSIGDKICSHKILAVSHGLLQF